MEHDDKRDQIILNIMDQLSEELMKVLRQTLEEAESFRGLSQQEINRIVLERFQSRLKSGVYHWLGVLYDETSGHEKDLRTAFDSAMVLINRLKKEKENAITPKATNRSSIDGQDP